MNFHGFSCFLAPGIPNCSLDKFFINRIMGLQFCRFYRGENTDVQVPRGREMQFCRFYRGLSLSSFVCLCLLFPPPTVHSTF